MKNRLVELAKEEAKEKKRKAQEEKKKSKEELLKAKSALAQEKAAKKERDAKIEQEQKELSQKIVGIANDFIDAYNKGNGAASDLEKSSAITVKLAKDGNFVAKMETGEETYYCQSYQQKGKTYLKIYNQKKARIDDGDSHYPQYTDGYYVQEYEAVVTQKGAKLAKDIDYSHSFWSLNSAWNETSEYKEFRESVIDVVDEKKKNNTNAKK